MSVLLPTSQEFLRRRGAKARGVPLPELGAPFTLGRWRVLPRTDGRFAVFSPGVVERGPSASWATSAEAFGEVMRLAALDASSGRQEAGA